MSTASLYAVNRNIDQLVVSSCFFTNHTIMWHVCIYIYIFIYVCIHTYIIRVHIYDCKTIFWIYKCCEVMYLVHIVYNIVLHVYQLVCPRTNSWSSCPLAPRFPWKVASDPGWSLFCWPTLPILLRQTGWLLNDNLWSWTPNVHDEIPILSNADDSPIFTHSLMIQQPTL